MATKCRVYFNSVKNTDFHKLFLSKFWKNDEERFVQRLCTPSTLILSQFKLKAMKKRFSGLS
jgi:hypothetical protein